MPEKQQPRNAPAVPQRPGLRLHNALLNNALP